MRSKIGLLAGALVLSFAPALIGARGAAAEHLG